MKPIRWIIIVLLLGGIPLGVSHLASAQASDSVYVTETGHWIWGEFLTTYNSAPDPLFYFGYPITDDFTDSETNLRVQYFQRARFELIESAEGRMVKITPLGGLMHSPNGQIADIPNEGPTCRSFSTGYSVCYAFLQYFDVYDGSRWFGNPISEVEVLDNHYVQYFEYVRLEWWPDRPSGERVVLSDLGSVYFDKYVGDSRLLQPSDSSRAGGDMVEPITRVFALRSLIGAGEQQTIYVVVQDQNLDPVQNAQVGVTLRFPDESKEFYRLAETNKFGISQFTFSVGNLPVQSIINVEAEINVRGESSSGHTSFKIWW